MAAELSIPEQLINQVFAKLPADIFRAIGEREKATNAGATRVIAIPVGAPEIVMTSRPGSEQIVDPLTNKRVSVRRLLSRMFDIEFHCHGEPAFVDAENLYLKVLVAVRNCFHHSVTFSNEQWLGQQDGEDGFTRWGTVIAFTATIDVPVYDAAQSTAVVNTFDTTGSIPGGA